MYNLARMTRFYNNLHPIRSKSKDIQRKKSNTDYAEYLTPVTTDVMQVDLRSLNNVMY
jgi:hypothetical protein